MSVHEGDGNEAGGASGFRQRHSQRPELAQPWVPTIQIGGRLSDKATGAIGAGNLKVTLEKCFRNDWKECQVTLDISHKACH